MSLAIVHSRALGAVRALPVTVEVHLANGLPGLSIVGLPEAAVRESKDRVRSALIQTGFEFPARRITINLAPADLPKGGGRFDLPIALGILAAAGQLPRDPLAEYEFVGELALDGQLRPVAGALTAALGVRGSGRSLVLPAENAAEAALVPGLVCVGAPHLLALSEHLHGRVLLPPQQTAPAGGARHKAPDLRDVRGQPHARRALEIAAAGGHSLLFVGPPGTGKTLLASRLPGLLPPLGDGEALEVAAIESLAGVALNPVHWRTPRFRAPHHTASAVALVGGGSHPRPGEISLAHHGVLFLDELPEFERRVLEVLREPLESGVIHISRAARQASFPATFQLVAAMNPCPCGYQGQARCRCTPAQVQRYRARISGPLLDRIDMHVPVPVPDPAALWGPPDGEDSADVARRVRVARERQQQRNGARPNARLAGRAFSEACALADSGYRMLQQAGERLGLSARAFDRIRRLARTVADLEGEPGISTTHLAEAIGYRRLDRNPAPRPGG
ncbi:MAG: YifB family Mg chelatase-like AAA ATPase [Gammaproteobacteria bacterium]|nr:YifB family Mg chelatase-like AAA ATPase [Gammaproteobacteria bacterium]